jgi:hypothetical protein
MAQVKLKIDAREAKAIHFYKNLKLNTMPTYTLTLCCVRLIIFIQLFFTPDAARMS